MENQQSHSSIARQCLPAVICGLLSVLPFLSLLRPGVFPFAVDILIYIWPNRAVALEALGQGHFPLWDAYSQFGQSLAGSPTSVFYPLFWLFLWGGWAGFKLYIATHYFLLGACAYVFFRRGLRCRVLPAMIGAVMVGCSGYMFSVFQAFYFLSAPWLLLFAAFWAMACRRFSRTLALAAGTSLAMGFLAAQMQETVVWLACVMIASWVEAVALRDYRPRLDRAKGLRVLLTTAWAGVIALVLCLPSLILTARAYGESVRVGGLGAKEIMQWQLHPLRLLELATPYTWGLPELGGDYLGSRLFMALGSPKEFEWAPLVFMGTAFFFLLLLRPLRCRLRLTAMCWALAATSVLLALGTHTSVFPLVLELAPFVGRFRYPQKWMFFLTIALACLTALKAEALRHNWPRRYFFLRLNLLPAAILLAALVTLDRLMWRSWTPSVVARNTASLLLFVVAGVALNAALWRLRRTAGRQAANYVLIGLLAVLAAETGRARLMTCVGLKMPDPLLAANAPAAALLQRQPNVDQFRLLSEIPVMAADSVARRGVQAAALAQTRMLNGASPALFGLRTASGLHALATQRQVVFQEALAKRGSWAQYLDLTAVRYLFVATTAGTAPGAYRLGQRRLPLLLLDQDYLFGIFENPTALPRVRLIGAWTSVATTEAAAAFLQQTPLETLRRQAVIESSGRGVPAVGSSLGAPGAATLMIRRERSGLFEAKITAATPVLLHYGDSYARGWHAYVDGREVGVLPANVAFMGVLIPPGEHELRLRYEGL